ncbi:MAG: cytochrome c oxidase subunit II [Microbacteriaceae bacterium]
MIRRPGPPAAMAAGVVALAGCAQGDVPQSTMDPKGEYAQTIFNLSWPVFLIAGVIGVVVFAIIGVLIVRFRERPGHEETPKQVHGKPTLEIALTVLPAVLLAAIAVPTVNVLFDINAEPEDALVVNVTGQQWWWEFDYPSITGDDGLPLVTANEMVIPAGQQVRLNITSRDVIHSFWIPKLNGKRDAVPGRVQTWNLHADGPGEYWGQCTEYCGLSHTNMRMRVIALTSADFERWVAQQKTDARAAEDETAALGEAQFKSLCASCHQVDGLKDAEGEQIVAQPQTQVYNGAAPNLTHLMSRGTFVSSNFDLLRPDCRLERDDLSANDPEAFSAAYVEGTSVECLNKTQLEAWLRDPPAIFPMFVDPTQLEATDGKYRGMPNLNLTETQIDQLVSYLQTLK